METRRMPRALVLVIDLVSVLAFCMIGRRSHAEGVLTDLPGLANTIWPFLVALLVAHAVVILTRGGASRVLPGIVIWAITVVGGLLLRAVSGQGTAVPFMIVTVLVLALFLIGWRLILALILRVRRRRADAES
ncbi:DUF3054 domain-containing protein [Microbacterium sp. GXF6406]